MTLLVETSHGKSPPCQDWFPWALQQWRYNVFSGCRSKVHKLAEVRHYYLSLEHMACNALAHKVSKGRHSYLSCHVNKFDIDHMRLEQPQKKTFTSRFRLAAEKKKKQKIMAIAKFLPLHANATKL